MHETFTLWVCVDCYVEHHYPGENDNPRAGIWNGRDVTSGGECDYGWDNHVEDCSEESHYEECEQITFSTSNCDGCNSTLAGSRHLMTEWSVTATD